jgi:ABC-type microcin C transport system permease subunit YejB
MTLRYIVARLLLIIPTMFGIMLIAFILVQFAPGGPVEQVLAKIHAQNPGFGPGCCRATVERRKVKLVKQIESASARILGTQNHED